MDCFQVNFSNLIKGQDKDTLLCFQVVWYQHRQQTPEDRKWPPAKPGSDDTEAATSDPGSAATASNPEGRKTHGQGGEAFEAADSWQETAESEEPPTESGAVRRERSEDEEEEDVWTEDWWRPQEVVGERPQLGRELRRGTAGL
ncbi:uncharacterized protein LOC144783125 [Lissotriton helveticus]